MSHKKATNKRSRLASGFTIPLVIVGFGIAVTFAGFTARAQSPSEQAAPSDSPSNLTLVEVVEAEPATRVTETRRFSGLLEAARLSRLGFERIGRVAAIRVDEGDVVRKDDILAELACDKLLAERLKLVADKAVEQEELRELLAGPRIEKIAAARARLDQAAARLELARTNASRRERLAKKQLVSRESLQTANADVEARSNEVRALEQELLELQNGTRKEQIDAKRARIAAIDSAIKVIDVDLDNSVVKAPFAGTIVARGLDEGTIVAPGQVILDLSETSHLRARFGIPMDVGAKIKLGQSVILEVGEKILTGKIHSFVSRVSSSTRTQTLLVSIPEKTSFSLYDGQAVRLRLQTESEISGRWLPRAALTRGTRGLWNCYVAEETDSGDEWIARRRVVEVLRTTDERVAVTGLETGEWIVASAPHRIAAGQRIRVRPRKVRGEEGRGEGDVAAKNNVPSDENR